MTTFINIINTLSTCCIYFKDRLFIGSSLTDPNIRRLLDIANSQKRKRKYHYILKVKINSKKIRKILDRILKNNPDIISEKVKAEIDFEETVNFLVDMHNRFEESDSESLGVKTVWIDDYDIDTAKILEKIRK